MRQNNACCEACFCPKKQKHGGTFLQARTVPIHNGVGYDQKERVDFLFGNAAYHACDQCRHGRIYISITEKLVSAGNIESCIGNGIPQGKYFHCYIDSIRFILHGKTETKKNGFCFISSRLTFILRRVFSGRVIRSVFFGVCAGSDGEKWSSIRIRSQKQDLHN